MRRLAVHNACERLCPESRVPFSKTQTQLSLPFSQTRTTMQPAASQPSDTTNTLAVPFQLHKKGRVYVIPQDNDVKCGRGRRCFEHPGNALLRVRVAFHLEAYRQQGNAAMKTKVIDSIIADIFAVGGRFLKLDHTVGLWYDAGFLGARLRIGSAFRDACQTNKVKCMEKLNALITQNQTCRQSNGFLIPYQWHSGSGSHPDSSSAASMTIPAVESSTNVATCGRTNMVERRTKNLALPQGLPSPRAPVCHVANAANDAFLFVPSGVVCVQPHDASTSSRERRHK